MSHYVMVNKATSGKPLEREALLCHNCGSKKPKSEVKEIKTDQPLNMKCSGCGKFVDPEDGKVEACQKTAAKMGKPYECNQCGKVCEEGYCEDCEEPAHKCSPFGKEPLRHGSIARRANRRMRRLAKMEMCEECNKPSFACKCEKECEQECKGQCKGCKC